MTDEKTLKPLIEHELAEANKTNPPFSSNHEAAAVIYEEVEEVYEDAQAILQGFEDFWQRTRHDMCTVPEAEAIYKNAVHLTAEAIQVAAMALKAMEVKGNARKIL